MDGTQTTSIKLSRGVQQGCPLSPYLFIICAEFLAEDIRQNNKIQGIKIGPKDFKIKQYADDTQIFSHFTVNKIIKTFSKFSSVSGLKINYNKTEVMRIGSIKKLRLYDQNATCLKMEFRTNQDTGDHPDPWYNQSSPNKY